MRPPILITGCARSGTSLVAGIVDLCGAWGGKMSGPTPHNKKGMFENSAIRNEIVKPFLKNIGVDPMGQNPLPHIDVCHEYARRKGKHWKNTIERIAAQQGYSTPGHCIWFYKGAKMCIMWPVWDAAFPDAQWIWVRRKDNDIINSCLRTGFMRAYNTRQGWQRWVDEHLKRLHEMKQAGLDIYEVWSQKIIDGDLSEIRDVVYNLGLRLGWGEGSVREFISPDLWGGAKNA